MTAANPSQNHAFFNFSNPVEVLNLTGADALLSGLIATPTFQRLKLVRFLGGIDYILVRAPNGARGNIRYTRYQHSLGVARLALTYCTGRATPIYDRRLISIAALLHDIGHAPLSHSLEPVFEEAFGLEHHRATEQIITGRSQFGREVYEMLIQNDVDVDKLVAMISGSVTDYDGFFSSPINFDTIEGILRSRTYTKANASIPSPEAVIEAAIRRYDQKDVTIVDRFWNYKDEVYRHIINSRQGILADLACQWSMREHLHQFRPDDYFSTEPEIFRKLPGLRKLLTGRSFETEMLKRLDKPVIYNARHFFIDPGGDFFGRHDSIRYKQTKEQRVLSRRDIGVAAVEELNRDLFDDQCDWAGQAAL
jgi:HD superfamily phosphohydrolase